MKNYAGHRLSPWLGHLMVSRQETARPLVTAGEIMQLPPADELVLVSGVPPIRAKKARYYEDERLVAQVLQPPSQSVTGGSGARGLRLSLALCACGAHSVIRPRRTDRQTADQLCQLIRQTDDAGRLSTG
jgi:type IV secretion system protein VirD4